MNYIRWHFLVIPKRLLQITDNFLQFFTHFFSIPLLLRTYFVPWHRTIEVKKERGLHIGKSIERLIGNIFSSFIGILLRSIVFAIWLLLIAETAVLGLLLTLLWLILPLVTLPFYFKHTNKPSPPRFWNKKTLLSIPSPTANWHFGYTPNIDKYSKDLTEKVYIVKNKIIGRDKELNEITRILSRKTQPAVILYGPVGSGRHAVILELARRIKTDSPTIPPQIRNFRIVKIDTVRLLATGIKRELNKNLFENLLLEAERAGNIILILDQVDKLTLFFDSLAPVIQRGEVKIIGLTTIKKYQLTLQKNELAQKLFETVKVSPLGRKFIVKILEHKASELNKQYKLIFPPETIKRIISLADKSQTPQPDSSLDLIEEISLAHTRSDSISGTKITPQDASKIAESKLKIPLVSLGEKEKSMLANLESLLNKYIINQQNAISQISNALRRSRLRFESANRPLASFLFLGPTGVGKTETAKALARIYFQNPLNSPLPTLNSPLIRFDMSGYQNKTDSERLVKELANKITQQPYAVLLLDEIEKAHKDLLNLFLTIIDEGYFKDLEGDRISCQNLFIIGTSNAASEYIRKDITAKTTDAAPKVINYTLTHNIFSPEFINRFDGVILFRPLNKRDLVQIARLKLEQLNERLKKEHNTSIEITDGLIGTIVEEGYKPEFGAREINRAIQRLVENPLAKKLLKE